MRKRLLGCALSSLVVFGGPACFFQTSFGYEFVEDVSDFVDAVFTAIDTKATIGICTTIVHTVSCQYFVNGVPVSSTASLANELGTIAGAIADPMVLELPAGVKDIAGTFNDGLGHSGNLLVYPNLSYVPADDLRTFVARPGKQLAILDLPPGTPIDNVSYDFSLHFNQLVPNGTGPTDVRAVFTGRFVVNGKTFYPPVLPCTTDMSLVPAIVMPRAATPQALNIPTGTTGCQNQFYSYFRAESGPPRTCDLDNDNDVDNNDVALVMARRNNAASVGDPRDVNVDGAINANDARACTTQCTKPRCAL